MERNNESPPKIPVGPHMDLDRGDQMRVRGRDPARSGRGGRGGRNGHI